MEMVGKARARATALTTEKIAHLLTGRMRGDLDALLVVDSEPETTPLAWLTTPAVEATAAAVKLAVDKLLFLRGMDAHHLDLSMLARERRRFPATVGHRSTVQGLERRGERRYPILLALVAQSAVDQLDEVIALFGQAVSARESRAKAKTPERGSGGRHTGQNLGSVRFLERRLTSSARWGHYGSQSGSTPGSAIHSRNPASAPTI